MQEWGEQLFEIGSKINMKKKKCEVKEEGENKKR